MAWLFVMCTFGAGTPALAAATTVEIDDLGGHNLLKKSSDVIVFEVGPQTISFSISALSKSSQSKYEVDQLISPRGQVIHPPARSYEPGMATLLYPNDGRDEFLEVGQWQVKFKANRAVKDDSLQVQIAMKKYVGGAVHKVPMNEPMRLRLIVYPTGSHGVAQANFFTTEFGREMIEYQKLMAAVGIQVEVEVGDDLPAMFQNITLNKKDNGSYEMAYQMLRAAPPSTNAIRIFVVEAFDPESTGVAARGYSMGAPLNFAMNGVLLSSVPFNDMARMFRTRYFLMHEIGHALGLFHVIENDGEQNHLKDTLNQLDNIMVLSDVSPRIDYKFSPSQIRVMKVSPFVETLK